jgi:hypothetical protein
MKKIISLSLAGLLIMSACAKLDLEKEITIKPGENYFIDYHTFFSIDSIHDYRCPSDIECLWSGDADIFFTASDGAASINIVAQLYSSDHNPVYFGNYKIKIVDVLPHLKSSDKFNLMNEQVKIIINKN